MGKMKNNVIANPAITDLVMRKRFIGTSCLIIALNTIFSDNVKVMTITFALMTVASLLFTNSGRVVTGTWFRKERWRTLNVSHKPGRFRLDISIVGIAMGLYGQTYSFSHGLSGEIVSLLFPVTEDITGSNMLMKIRGFIELNIPALISSLFFFLSLYFITGCCVKRIQINLSSRLLLRVKNSEEAKRVLQQMTWDQFEGVLRKFFESKGYQATLTSNGADGGIDILLRKGQVIEMVQAKHWKTNRVGVAVIREIYGVIQAEGFHRGFIITSGLFTTEAREFADKVSGKVILIDGDLLIEIIKADSFFERVPQNTPHIEVELNPTQCKVCGGEMILRNGNKKTFWGCGNYPECRYTREV